MGLLDDAIREHLELKRLRGADPGEVAREQSEVLDSPAEAGAAGSQSGSDDPAVAALADPPRDAGEASDDTRPADEPAEDAPLDSAGQAHALGETAELDMSSVLGADEARDGGADAQSLETEPSSANAPPPPEDEDSVEWEVPAEAGQSEAEEQDEDVLEETPDFLRDTPEQDRLWFEQRPPRDFDFDK